MKILFATTSLFFLCSDAFVHKLSRPSLVRPQRQGNYDTPSSLVELRAVTEAAAATTRVELLDTAESLNKEFGCLLVDSKAQERLREAVEKLESVADPPTSSAGLIGTWTLLCSTASISLQEGSTNTFGLGIELSKLPFWKEGPLKTVRDTLNKALSVQQVVKTSSTTTEDIIIDRIDHVIQYSPPGMLSAFLDDTTAPFSIPDAVKNFNINPLEVTKSKVILVHKANVESVTPKFETQLSLSSIIVNVAGTSQRLEPNGDDILGINIPSLKEFLGNNYSKDTFLTTYMDDTLRISRSKVGIVDQLRVFVRTAAAASAASTSEGVSDVDMTTTTTTVVTDGDVVASETNGDDAGSEKEDDVSPSDY